jgi:hypothetical protein
LCYRRALAVIDGDGTNLLGERQAVGMAIDDDHSRSAFDGGRIARQQAHRPRAIDDDGLARLHAGELGRVPAGREDVGEHDVIGLLLLRVRQQDEAIEIGIRHAEVFGLAALIGTHLGIAIGAARGAGIDRQAEAGEAALAILAEAAGDG